MERLRKPRNGDTLEIKELDQRRSDSLTVTLWWVKGTLDTYVTVLDGRTEETLTVQTPEGVAPHEVYYHPMAFVEQPES